MIENLLFGIIIGKIMDKIKHTYSITYTDNIRVMTKGKILKARSISKAIKKFNKENPSMEILGIIKN